MQTIEEMRQMTANDLAMLGMQDVAYVKQVMVDGNAGYAIHAADGTQMALIGDRDIAFAVVRQNELNSVRLARRPAGQQRVERVGAVGAAQLLAHRPIT
jgi:hypothetical protein